MVSKRDRSKKLSLRLLMVIVAVVSVIGAIASSNYASYRRLNHDVADFQLSNGHRIHIRAYSSYPEHNELNYWYDVRDQDRPIIRARHLKGRLIPLYGSVSIAYSENANAFAIYTDHDNVALILGDIERKRYAACVDLLHDGDQFGTVVEQSVDTPINEVPDEYWQVLFTEVLESNPKLKVKLK